MCHAHEMDKKRVAQELGALVSSGWDWLRFCGENNYFFLF